MNLAGKLTALLTSLTRGQVTAMAPIDRRQLADQCRRILALAEAAEAPRSGVLADLQQKPRQG